MLQKSAGAPGIVAAVGARMISLRIAAINKLFFYIFYFDQKLFKDKNFVIHFDDLKIPLAKVLSRK